MSFSTPTMQARIETLYQKNRNLVAQIDALKDKATYARFVGLKDDGLEEKKILVKGSELLTSWDPGNRILYVPQVSLKEVIPSRVKTLDQIQKANETIFQESKEMALWLLNDKLNTYLEFACSDLYTLGQFLTEQLDMLDPKIQLFSQMRKKLQARAESLSTLREHSLELVSNVTGTLNPNVHLFYSQSSGWAIAHGMKAIADQICFWQVQVVEPIKHLALCATWDPALNQLSPHVAQTRGFSLRRDADQVLHCLIWDGLGMRTICKLDQALSPLENLTLILNCPGKSLTLKFRDQTFHVHFPKEVEGPYYPMLALQKGSILYNK